MATKRKKKDKTFLGCFTAVKVILRSAWDDF